MTADPRDRPPRPVVLASAVMLCAAGLGVLDVIASRLAVSHLDDAAPAYIRVMAKAEIDGADRSIELYRIALGTNVTVAAGAVVVFGVLAVAVRRRSRLARALTWAATAIAVLAFGSGIAGNPEAFSGNAPDAVEQARSGLLPGWYSIARSLLTTAELLTVLTASALLLRTAAADFYRRQGAEQSLSALLIERQARQQPPAN